MGSIYTSKRKRVGLQLYTATRTNVETSGDSHSNAQRYNGTGSGFTNLLRVVSMSLSSIIPGYGPRVLTHNFRLFCIREKAERTSTHLLKDTDIQMIEVTVE
jgi:hypothetical protein